jgi:UDP-N-acetylglucosamine acyltransferase
VSGRRGQTTEREHASGENGEDMIHPTAVISPEAKLGTDVEVGPYVVIDKNVEVGDGCTIAAHAHLTGHTRIGNNTAIHTGAVIGGAPQDLHYDGSESYTVIGDNCVLREYVTIHRGSDPGTTTSVGNGVMLMAFSHLGHNCVIEDGVVVANASLLAGHVEVGARAFISGMVAIHQFVRVGTMAMIGGKNGVAQDVPPYCTMQYGAIRGPNVVGLRRGGVDAEARQAVRDAIKTFFFSGLNRPTALTEILAEHSDVAEVRNLVAFIESTKRGITPGGTRRQDRGAGQAE